jgi:hypothetical protein
MLEAERVRKGLTRIDAIRTDADLPEIPDRTFLKLAHAAGMFDQNLLGVLIARLEFRNRCAHANSYRASLIDAESFAQELITNVVDPSGMVKWGV